MREDNKSSSRFERVRVEVGLEEFTAQIRRALCARVATYRKHVIFKSVLVLRSDAMKNIFRIVSASHLNNRLIKSLHGV